MDNKLINIIANKNYEARRVKADFTNKLIERDYKISKNFSHSAALTVTIGGDGSFLKAVHNNNFPQTPIVGINTGHLGFFQEINPDEIDVFLDKLEGKNYSEEKLPLIKADIYTKNKKFTELGINEIIVKGKNSKVIQISTYIDGTHLENFAGDGLMISTPAGSTAYNFSFGGSIVHSSLRILQMMPMAPLNNSAYRSLKSGIIIPGESKISMEIPQRYKNGAHIVVDGNEKEYWNINRVEFTMSKKYITRFVFKDDHYWLNIKDKFL